MFNAMPTLIALRTCPLITPNAWSAIGMPTLSWVATWRIPKLFMHPKDAARQNIHQNDGVKLETKNGEVSAKVLIQASMKEGHIRVPHGWWYPEMRGSAQLAGAFISSDAVLCSDEPEFLDHEQGIPRFKGFPGRIVKLNEPPAGMSEKVMAG